MGKYHKLSERLAIVKDYFNSNCSIREYAKEHNIANSTLSDWIREYKFQYCASDKNKNVLVCVLRCFHFLLFLIAI